MAGTLAIVPSERVNEAAASIREQWEIQFARFFSYPTLSSTCPDLVPLTIKVRKQRRQGTWVSSSSSAVLELAHDLSGSETILTVCFRGRNLEQHYVSKLHFSWPQVSCLSGYPARGIRVVFVSYKDHVGEIQKFALRFSTNCETQIFINALKDILKDARDFAPLTSNLGSEILSQSEFMSSNGHPDRACEEDLSFMDTVQAYTPQMSPSFNTEVEQHSSEQEKKTDQEKQTAVCHEIVEMVAALPPSFTSLLTNCYSEVTQGATKSSVCKEVDLKSQIMRYMEDSSFQDMLMRVEKVISEMGGNMTL
ncbi:protein POOR HOMOLOGOUS SYNAPSIS 1 isoform X2 [Corylus avellana]|uniref:protein POOR HOMOLOGOUS SYNAPSIS 1 isoform X2 n=1 Tax=Corylus avellana TaxID=13451 RepID=UPI00286D5546|nr:protein POOR HOMOLOGOUS SYNAPSIS 1 isoform X2 [Corylus avellana]